MKRYNQGFFKFGPMEQCKDGMWAKYTDFLRVLHYAVKQKNVQIENLTQELDYAKSRIKTLEQRLVFADQQSVHFGQRLLDLFHLSSKP